VARHRGKSQGRRRLSQWWLVLVGCGVGGLLVAAGVAVRHYGSGFEHGSGGVEGRDVGTVGLYLIGVGVLAVALTVALAVVKSREGAPARKGRKRRR
jgi:hypothetical protein